VYADTEAAGHRGGRGEGLGHLGRGKAKAAPKRRPSAANSIIRAEVAKDTGPIYLQASFFGAATTWRAPLWTAPARWRAGFES
jgi:hypothetical protein